MFRKKVAAKENGPSMEDLKTINSRRRRGRQHGSNASVCITAAQLKEMGLKATNSEGKKNGTDGTDKDARTLRDASAKLADKLHKINLGDSDGNPDNSPK